MSIADSLPDAVATVAKAVGVLDGGGNLDPAFFDHPLRAVSGMLTRPTQRQAFVGALPILLGDAAAETTGEGERRRYPLVVEGSAELSLAVDLVPTTADTDITLLVTVRAMLSDSPAAFVT